MPVTFTQPLHAGGLLAAYRTVNGTGNNLTHSDYNAYAGSDEIRLAPANYAPGTTDGLIDGPNPREISNIVASGPEALLPDDTGFSAWGYVFGQFVDHDLDLTTSGGSDISIPILNGDPTLPAGSSITMTRANNDSANGHAAINSVAGWLDLSQVYGSDATNAASLRTPDGHLRTSSGDNLSIHGQQFVAGDVRVMENPELIANTTLFVREHNFWVDQLHAQHRDWTGDQLYDQAKAITTAEYQNIIYTEFVPGLVGDHTLTAYHGYDANVDPRITEEFSFAAYRVGHSMVSGEQTHVDNLGNVLSTQSLADAFTSTIAQDEANGGANSLMRHLGSEAGQKIDVYAVDELRNDLNAPPVATDLIAIDIQRERDAGIGTLNQVRESLGFQPYTAFDQITSDPTVAAHLQQAFGSVDNIDLFMGGLAENHVAGADVGATFQAIIARQFEAVRDGDRFWWQNEGFDQQTQQMISNTTLSDLIMRDTDTTNMQPHAFVAASRHSSAVAADDPSEPQLIIGTAAANAVIQGGPADDTLVAGTGVHQILTGGGGDDTFVFDDRGHNATVSDFNVNFDNIEFYGAAASAAPASIHDVSGGALLSFNGNTIDLPGVSASQFTQHNLTFLDEHALPITHNLIFA